MSHSPIFICYDAGSNTYCIEPFNSSTDWHCNEFAGTYTECERYKQQQEEFVFNSDRYDY